MELKTCPECGVPETITGEQLWLNNGDIVQKRKQEHRLVFTETECIDPIFHGIERIIRATIEPIVITAGRRSLSPYLKAFVPAVMSEKIRNKEMDVKRVVDQFCDLGRTYGSGSYQFVDMRYEGDEDDYCTYSISEPYSLPMTIAYHVADVEVLTGIEQGYRYEEVSTNLYDITAFPSPHPEGLRERMRVERYEHRDGGLELERCATCGGPMALSGYQWHPDRGVIANRTSGRRVAIQGSSSLEPIFEELEAELGEAVPRAAVEAQRRFTRSGFYTLDDVTTAEDYRVQLALRGLGNLTELVMKRKGMRLRLENAALPLITIGQAQGFFEIGYGVDSTVDWELDEQRNLQMEVKPKG